MSKHAHFLQNNAYFTTMFICSKRTSIGSKTEEKIHFISSLNQTDTILIDSLHFSHTQKSENKNSSDIFAALVELHSEAAASTFCMISP